MNAAHLHLAVNHFPVVLFFFGALLLLLSFFIRNIFWQKAACLVIVSAAVFSVPAYVSGEGAEHYLEKLGTAEAIIEPHEKTAKVAFGAGLVTGAGALVVWLAAITGNRFLRALSIGLAVAVALTSGAFFYTSFQGGKIVHAEIRGGSVAAPGLLPGKVKNGHSDD